ncbi:MAG: glycosyltransferase family 2 protein [Acidobacteria bacterium]|nr:glycosyltransferase family 2 protein [Acidobacteriota bacterium]
MTLSVVIITHNEEANLARTLEAIRPLLSDGRGEIIVVDSGSSDRTLQIARAFGARVFMEEWQGYAAQKNSAIQKAGGDWILSLDADESLDQDLVREIQNQLAEENDACARQPAIATAETNRSACAHEKTKTGPAGFWIRRRNYFLGRWIRHGGFWPDRKLRLFRRGSGRFEDRPVHEDIKLNGPAANLEGTLLHHSYPSLSDYLDHMNRYSSLGAEMAFKEGRRGFNPLNILLRPLATFIYNYFFRLGFLDGREGLLLHLYHAVYVSWKYAKVWELTGQKT